MKSLLKIIGMPAIIAAVLIPEVAYAQYGYGRVHRATRRRTAVVVHSATKAQDQQAMAAQQQATAQQQAQQQATAEQQAATAAQQAATAEQQAATAAQQAAAAPPLALGTVVPALPSGCTNKPVGGVQYYECGKNYYRAVFQGNSLVYVTVESPQ
jgi:hypothetical protein